MNEDKSFNERLKKMKKSVKENADVLDSEFPADVTNTGSADLVKKSNEHKDEEDEK